MTIRARIHPSPSDRAAAAPSMTNGGYLSLDDDFTVVIGADRLDYLQSLIDAATELRDHIKEVG